MRLPGTLRTSLGGVSLGAMSGDELTAASMPRAVLVRPGWPLRFYPKARRDPRRASGLAFLGMDRFNDLDIPESLEDALRPATLALVVYDVQVGILSQIAGGDRVLANVLQVLAAARERRVRTVFLRHYFMP